MKMSSERQYAACSNCFIGTPEDAPMVEDQALTSWGLADTNARKSVPVKDLLLDAHW
jgi:hypothetical protein